MIWSPGTRWSRAIRRACTGRAVSLRGRMVSEYDVAEEDWEDFVIEEDI